MLLPKGTIDIDFNKNTYFSIYAELRHFGMKSFSFYYFPSISEQHFVENTLNIDSYAHRQYETAYFAIKNEVIPISPRYIYIATTFYTEWEIGDRSIVDLDENILVAKNAGVTWVRAHFAGIRSEKMWIYVSDNPQTEYVYLTTYTAKPVKVNTSTQFTPYAIKIKQYNLAEDCFTDSGIIYNLCSAYVNYRYVYSDKINLHSSAGDAGIANKTTFTSKVPGLIDVWLEYQGLQSNVVIIDFWDDREMHYCDGVENNVAEWKYTTGASVTLEANCNEYEKDETVYVKYTAQIPSGSRYGDHCLDLYILDENHKIVRTLREEMCSTEPLHAGRSSSRSMTKIYQSVEGWDMKDSNGNEVEAGKYYAVARFYIYFDPVIEVPFVIKD